MPTCCFGGGDVVIDWSSFLVDEGVVEGKVSRINMTNNTLKREEGNSTDLAI